MTCAIRSIDDGVVILLQFDSEHYYSATYLKQDEAKELLRELWKWFVDHVQYPDGSAPS